MSEDNVELRGLVHHLSRVLQEEKVQRGGSRSGKPAPRGRSVNQWSEPPGQDSSPQSSGTWQWQDWHIHPVSGGMNGRVFRASGLADDVSVEFVVRDQRDRAGREWAALTMLAQHFDSLPLQPPSSIETTTHNWPSYNPGRDGRARPCNSVAAIPTSATSSAAPCPGLPSTGSTADGATPSSN